MDPLSTCKRLGWVLLLPVLGMGCGSSGSGSSAASALARAAADEAAALLPDGGQAVLIQISDAPFPLKDEAAIDEQLTRELKDRGIRIAATEELSFDPRMETTGEPFNADALVAVVSRHPEVDLFISRVGLPRLSFGDVQRLPSPRPRLMIVTNYQVPYLKWLPPGIPDVAIIPRMPGAPAEASASEDPAGFEQLYQIIRVGEVLHQGSPQP